MDIWEDDREIPENDRPEWVESGLNFCNVAAICEGGCASGAYMPAVTYHEASATMAKHGDDVLDYIGNTLGEISAPQAGESWSGLAVFYLSMAVEIWAGEIQARWENGDFDNDNDDNDDNDD